MVSLGYFRDTSAPMNYSIQVVAMYGEMALTQLKTSSRSLDIKSSPSMLNTGWDFSVRYIVLGHRSNVSP